MLKKGSLLNYWVEVEGRRFVPISICPSAEGLQGVRVRRAGKPAAALNEAIPVVKGDVSPSTSAWVTQGLFPVFADKQAADFAFEV